MMYIRWILSVPFSWAIVLITWILSPILALPSFSSRDLTTGREWLIKPLSWFSTFDNPLDEWWFGEYYKSCSWFGLKNKTDEDYLNNSWIRYVSRLFWICRNPGSGFQQHLFGWTGSSTTTSEVKYKVGQWDSSSTNYSLVVYTNPEASVFGKNAFYYTAQYFFYKNHYLRINIGWKPHAGYDDLMLATFISPFRTWNN